MKSSIVYFFLFVLRIFFDLISDNVYKCNRFLKSFLKKNLEFVSDKKFDPIIFDPSLMLLPTEVDPIPKKQNCKKDAFVALASTILK